MKDVSRAAARTKIIQACNQRKHRIVQRHRLCLATRGKIHAEITLFGPDQIQAAVCMARRFGLVDDATLAAAGYRTVAR